MSEGLLKSIRHLPKAHADHRLDGCGCVEPGHPNARRCPSCGATYDWTVVYTFRPFQCYDCSKELTV